MSFIRCALIFALVIWGPKISAQDVPAVADNAQPSASDASELRPTVSTTWQQRGAWLGESREVLNFAAAGGEEAWLVAQRARGTPIGNVLLISASSVGGPGHMAGLHAQLPAYGWHTFHLNVASDNSVTDLLQPALAALPVAPRLLVICEGKACLSVAQDADSLGATGLVCVNLPARDNSSRRVMAQLEPLKTIEMPSLVLQEDPLGWPRYQPVGADVEMHLLPRGHAGRANSRVLRQLRGWLKRRHKIG